MSKIIKPPNLYKEIYGIDFLMADKIDINTESKDINDNKNNHNKQAYVENNIFENKLNIQSRTIIPQNISEDPFELSIQGCSKCILYSGRTNIVIGDGNINARLMFIGEGPGADEDKQGKPFVGKAGQLLTKMINAMGLERSEVYIANIVKCRPPENRAPFKEEAAACIPYLHKQIEYIKPEIIVCLGSVATTYLLNTDKSISKLRGTFIDYNGIKVMPTFHPSYLLRSPNMKKFAWEDLQAVMKLLGLPIKQQ